MAERTNAALRALKACLRGSLRGFAGEALRPVPTLQPAAGPLQLRLQQRVAEAHRRAHGAGLYALDPVSARERLLARPSAAPYGGTAPAAEGLPLRGEVVALSKGVASLPPRGTAPTRLVDVSPRARHFFENFGSLMLAPSSELDLEAIAACRAYMDPTLRDRKKWLSFAADLWEAGLCGLTPRKVCHISVFFVFKKSSDEGWVLRPVWDLRLVNQYFRRPPHMTMGGPSALAELDLSAEVRQGRVLHALWGDLPDYFHRCEVPEVMWPYLVLDGISVEALSRELEARGRPALRRPRGRHYVALRVAAMGWSWAPCLCHSALEDMVVGKLEAFPVGGQVIMGRPPPDFVREAFLHWLYMDDYASACLLEPSRDQNLDELHAVQAGVKDYLKERGFPVHKDGFGQGVPETLGMTISTEDGHRLRPSQAKLALLLAATRGLLLRPAASSLEVSRLLGSWIWIMTIARAGMALFSGVFRFVEAYREDQLPHAMWDAVRDELNAAYYLAPLLEVDLEAPFSDWVFATDSSMQGYAVVRTTAEPEEIRAEVRRRFPASVEAAVAGASDLPRDGPPLPPVPASCPGAETKRRWFADVFSGVGGIGQAVARSCKVSSLFVDTAIDSRHDLLRDRNMRRLLRLIASGAIFAMHLAPPCGTWSRARLPRLRRPGLGIRGLPGLRPHQRAKLAEGTALMDVAIRLAWAMLAAGLGFSLENPGSSMVWEYPAMRELANAPGVFCVDLVYCSYGMRWLKPTRFLTNIRALAALASKCSRDHEHIALRGAAPCGTLWTKLACAYPPDLCAAYGEHIFTAVTLGELSLSPPLQSAVAARQADARVRPTDSAWARPDRWQVEWSGTWSYKEHINIQELRTISFLARHLGRSSKRWNQRYLVLTDSLVSLHAVTRMRSTSAPLLRQLLPIAACQLATGVRLSPRWIPTDDNPADGPSRGRPLGWHPAAAAPAAEEPADDPFAPREEAPDAHYAPGWHL